MYADAYDPVEAIRSRAIALPLLHPERFTISWTTVVTVMVFQPVPQLGWLIALCWRLCAAGLPSN